MEDSDFRESRWDMIVLSYVGGREDEPESLVLSAPTQDVAIFNSRQKYYFAGSTEARRQRTDINAIRLTG